MKRHFGKWLTAAALAVGCTVMTANAFADTDGHWAESAINKWSGEYGIIQGYDDGTFRPDKSITRGAFAGILDRFLHFQNASPADTFSDTAGTYWEDAILKLHASGIYLGNQGAALPSSTITRQQAVAMIGRAFRIAPETAAPDYTDTDQIAEYAMAYVGEFEVRGYLTDSAAGTFRPTDPITRAELSVIVWQVMSFDDYIHFSSHVLEKLDGVPVNRYDNAAFVKTDGRMEYVGGDRASLAGVDVSSHQGTVDWAKVAADGIDFVIIRCGGRYYGSGKVFEDKQFKSNIRGALDAGLQVGVYFFSQATNQTEALEEAQFVLDTIADYPVDGPVVFDWENIGTDSARTDGMTSAQVTAAANAFCGRIKAAGYQPMIYFNQYIGYLLYDLDQVTQYPFWLAEYTDKPTFYYHFEMWQYTSSGSVDGITGKVDRNLWMPKEAPVRPDRPSQETEPGEDEEAMPPSQDISREQS